MMPRRAHDGKGVIEFPVDDSARAGQRRACGQHGILERCLRDEGGGIVNDAGRFFLADAFQPGDQARYVHACDIFVFGRELASSFSAWNEIQFWGEFVQAARAFGVVGIFMLRGGDKGVGGGHEYYYTLTRRGDPLFHVSNCTQKLVSI